MKQTSVNTLETSIRLFKAFSDPVRLRILNPLWRDREVCVCHLHDALELPQPTVSRHLAYLRRLKLVVGRKEGLWVHYRLAQPVGDLHRTLIGPIASCLADLDELQRDRERLARLVSCEGGGC